MVEDWMSGTDRGGSTADDSVARDDRFIDRTPNVLAMGLAANGI
jgi:hypothetical protein